MTITTEEKLGTLLILGFAGKSATSENQIIKDIENHSIGGVILFDRLLTNKSSSNNIISRDQVKRLTSDLQNASSDNLLICVDQEGGMVNRFKQERGFSTTDSAFKLGKDHTLSATEKAAEKTATLLSELGINFNLAPVADLNSYPQNPIIGKYERSFSADPARVVKHAKAWIEQHRRKNILSCLKHFPGHGSARADSHKGFVDISETWQEEELLPYQQLNKLKMIDSVMTGHLFNAHHDNTFPATLSESTIQKLLREKVNYNGPLLSDDMQMGAIVKHYGLEEACCKAIAAGIDLLIIGNNLIATPDIAHKLITALKAAIDRGSLSENRVEEAWQRVKNLKKRVSNR